MYELIKRRIPTFKKLFAGPRVKLWFKSVTRSCLKKRFSHSTLDTREWQVLFASLTSTVFGRSVQLNCRRSPMRHWKMEKGSGVLLLTRRKMKMTSKIKKKKLEIYLHSQWSPWSEKFLLKICPSFKNIIFLKCWKIESNNTGHSLPSQQIIHRSTISSAGKLPCAKCLAWWRHLPNPLCHMDTLYGFD